MSSFLCSSKSDGLSQTGFQQPGLLLQDPAWIPKLCGYMQLPELVSLLPAVAMACTDRRCFDEAIDYVARSNKLRASLRGTAVWQLLVEVGGLPKKEASDITHMALEIDDSLRIMAMGQAIDEQRDALLLMVFALCSVPEEVRNRMEKKLIAIMGALA